MEACFNMKKVVKDLFQALEPEGEGQIHKETLKIQMQTFFMGKKFEDKEIDEFIENLCPDEGGMISAKSYMERFTMPGFSAEQAAATRRILKNRPELLVEGLMKGEELAEKYGVDHQKVEKIISVVMDCFSEKLDHRLKKDPPKSNEEVLEIENHLVNGIVNLEGSKDMAGKKK